MGVNHPIPDETSERTSVETPERGQGEAEGYADVPPVGPARLSPKELGEKIHAHVEAEPAPDEGESGEGEEEEGQPAETPLRPSHVSEDASPCPFCNGTGWSEIIPRDDPTRARCETCDGEGKVYTGSKIPENAVLDCPTCMGRGYVDRPYGEQQNESTTTAGTEAWQQRF